MGMGEKSSILCKRKAMKKKETIKGPKYCSLCPHNSEYDWCEKLNCDTMWTVGRKGKRPDGCPMPKYERSWEDDLEDMLAKSLRENRHLPRQRKKRRVKVP